mmetsp:Transcript_104870/g.325938  ORF Transcript_104870/g.325938 Transcript_104870/m.325938 type:complete len:268 (-) Transcript_104870:571-1374(-)
MAAYAQRPVELPGGGALQLPEGQRVQQRLHLRNLGRSEAAPEDARGRHGAAWLRRRARKRERRRLPPCAARRVVVGGPAHRQCEVAANVGSRGADRHPVASSSVQSSPAGGACGLRGRPARLGAQHLQGHGHPHGHLTGPAGLRPAAALLQLDLGGLGRPCRRGRGRWHRVCRHSSALGHGCRHRRQAGTHVLFAHPILLSGKRWQVRPEHLQRLLGRSRGPRLGRAGPQARPWAGNSTSAATLHVQGARIRGGRRHGRHSTPGGQG